MRLLQYTGPFKKGQRIVIPPRMDYEYVQIGIQLYKREPMYYTFEQKVEPDLKVNGISYQVPFTEILEFDGLAEISWTIEFLKDMPPESIIDFTYTTGDE